METYSINVVEQLTGVKAHTLRIWEKRYKKFIPHRTTTNIRYYDNDQLRMLLNVSTLLKHGQKISRIMGLTDKELNDQILALSEKQTTGDVFDLHINTLVNYMLVFDEPSFDKTCASVMIRYGLYEAMLKVIYPFLRKTGVLWSTDNVAPAQEHFASNIIKRKLLTAIDWIPVPESPKKKFLLFLPPDEWHEIGLLLSDFLIRSSGASCIYLGQNVPFESMEIALDKTKATHLLTLFTSAVNIDECLKKILAIAARNGKPVVLAGTSSEIKTKSKYLIPVRSIDILLTHL